MTEESAAVIRKRAVFVQDVEFLIFSGLHGPSLARRLHTNQRALSRRLTRNGRSDLAKRVWT